MRRHCDTYMQTRQGIYQFRFQIPASVRAAIGRSEIRLTLNTSELSIARQRVAVALPHIYTLKRLCRNRPPMSAEHFERAIKFAVKRVVDTLERWQQPWINDKGRLPEYLEMLLFKQAFGEWPDLAATLELDTEVPRVTSEREDEIAQYMLAKSRGPALARTVLTTLGIEATDDSKLFADLSVEMAKLQVGIRRAMEGRSKCDYRAEERLTSYYRRMGLVPSKAESAAFLTPRLSEAWKIFSTEKTSAPQLEWSPKTARGQDAIFNDWREIIGDIRVGEVTREIMLRYRAAQAKLPANRHKRYPGKSIAELLTMNIPADQRPANRTVQEKLVQIGAFLKWCRETQNYLTTDPMIGVHFEANSQSYAPFSQDDLRKLFNSREYEEGRHLKSWQYWIPLIALYSGARQAEIAQLFVRNVVQEEGVWLLVITEGEDQRVKTSAGVRKVPISRKLVGLGFLEYLAFLQERGEERLFPDLKKGPYGWGHKVSRWFGDVYKKNTGIGPDATGRRKVFHSFRHTAITKALSKSLSIAHTQQIFGHEKSLLGESATYMSAFPLQTLVPVIEALDYGLDHSAYKDSWQSYVKEWPAAELARTCVREKQAA
jgi:integrase